MDYLCTCALLSLRPARVGQGQAKAVKAAGQRAEERKNFQGPFSLRLPLLGGGGGGGDGDGDGGGGDDGHIC